MKPEIRIAKATAADVPLIFELIRGLAEYEKLGDQVTATEDKLRDTLFGERSVADVLLAFADEECTGFALFYPNYSTFLAMPGMFLEDLYVKPEWRNKRIGNALLKRVAQTARERGCGRLEWEVLDWNEPSIGFYKSLGAVPMNEWTKYRVTGTALDKLAQG